MALIPPYFIDCVVALGTDDAEGNRKWVASGFLYGHYVTNTEDEKRLYRVYLVTNRHVLGGLSKVYLRFNPQVEEQAREFPLSLVDNDGAPLWQPNPKAEVDVAVVPINFQLLKKHAMQVAYFESDRHVASVERMSELGITEGDFAYVLGFPMGLVGNQRNTVIVRSGTIARIRDALARANPTFLIDAFVFPGNSGGPVILKPDIMSIEGTKTQDTAYLIGVIQSYVPYEDVAISLQTRRPRVLFEENSGLARAHTADSIEETIQLHLQSLADKEGGGKAECSIK